MHEPGSQFLPEPADRGYGVVFEVSDVVVISPDQTRTRFFPIELLYDERLNLLFQLAMSQFAAVEAEFDRSPPGFGQN